MDNLGGNISTDCTTHLSPGMTKYYIPTCDSHLKPSVNKKFPSLNEGIQFYKRYALACGFDIRLGATKMSTDGKCVMWKYVYCSKEGGKNSTIRDDCKRRAVSKRVYCMACVVFKFVGLDGYAMSKFIEQHTHTFVPEAYKHFMKMNTTLDYGHQKFILNCAKANVGAMGSYKVLKTIAGSYAKIGCTSNQVKNFSRDLKAYALGMDEQMLIDNLFKKRELCSAFFFEFETDGEDHLKTLFWADPIARRNYCSYSDVISFDATYNTNRYNMIFAPFTGKDNHGRCVTLGAALMSGESVESYAWVFEQFKKCMGHGPTILMTDQDPAIKIAVERVLTGTKHRLCMWHIMTKIPEKLPISLKKDPLFMKDFCSLVWSVHIEPDDFDARWKQIMVDSGLVQNEWFDFMFRIRETWIPAFFRDVPMGGLFRTTSPSESENSFFRTHMNKHSNLLEFFMYFDNAMDSQRHSQAKLNNEDLSCCVQLKTLLPIEKHAAKVYTRAIFNEVQEDIQSACYACRLKNITDDLDRREYVVEERNNGFFNVSYNKVEETVVCSFKKFVRMGLLCSHVYFVFKDLNFENIPDKYIASRWTKLALSSTSHMVGVDVQEACDGIEKNGLLLHDTIADFYSCVGLADGDHEKTMKLNKAIKDIKDFLLPSEGNISIEPFKKRLFEQFYSSSIPQEVFVQPPVQVRTKGSGSWLKPTRETLSKQNQKPMRMCRNCHTLSHHDARNCPKDE